MKNDYKVTFTFKTYPQKSEIDIVKVITASSIADAVNQAMNAWTPTYPELLDQTILNTNIERLN